MFNHGLFQHHKLVNSDLLKNDEKRFSIMSVEKDQARFMINSALRGLTESERSSNSTQENVDLNSLSNFVQR